MKTKVGQLDIASRILVLRGLLRCQWFRRHSMKLFEGRWVHEKMAALLYPWTEMATFPSQFLQYQRFLPLSAPS